MNESRLSAPYSSEFLNEYRGGSSFHRFDDRFPGREPMCPASALLWHKKAYCAKRPTKVGRCNAKSIAVAYTYKHTVHAPYVLTTHLHTKILGGAVGWLNWLGVTIRYDKSSDNRK